MIEGWKYIKLTDVVSFVGDGDWIESRHQSNEGIRLIQTGNIGNGYFKAKEDKPHYISERTFHELGCTEVFPGDCLVSRLPDPVGRACLVPDIGNRMITAVDCTILRFKDLILPAFFVYYSRSRQYEHSIGNNTTGTTRKRISRKNLETISIPLPAQDVQKQIVAELDLLSGILDKQNTQLKELDTLAQSIFYDMFGNPVENDRGWTMCVLGKICGLKAGKSIKASELSDEPQKGLYPCYGGNGVRGYIRKKSHSGCFPIIGRQGALCGNVNLASGDFYATEHAVVCTPSKELDPVFLFYLLTEMNLNQYAKGVAQPGLAVGNITPLPIIVPELHHQQSFAAKIEAIEHQKTMINQAILETQKLFDYTMDKYFG